MRKACLSVFISIILFPAHLILAQSEVEVTKPYLSLKDNGIQIEYQLLNSSESDKFTIRIEVTDANGRFINANTLSGDVGENIPGGRNKVIFWDIEADSIYLNEEIFVQVYAVAEAPPLVEVLPEVVEVLPQAEEETAQNVIDSAQNVEETTQNVIDSAQNMELMPKDEDVELDPPLTEEKKVMERPSAKSFNRTGIIIQSMLLPGLGLSRVNSGQPHWIKGVVGYGCIAGTLYFNRKAVTSETSYLGSNDSDERDILFADAVRQDNISEALAYTAIGIWVADLVWTILGTTDLNMDQSSANYKGFSIGTTVEPVSSVPLLALRYKF